MGKAPVIPRNHYNELGMAIPLGGELPADVEVEDWLESRFGNFVDRFGLCLYFLTLGITHGASCAVIGRLC